MDTLQCAIVLAKLDHFDQEIEQRQAVARRYHALLAVAPAGVQVLPWPKEDRTSVFAQYSILVNDRDILQRQLSAADIPTAVHYPVPLNEQPAYRHLCCPHCSPVASQIAKKIICLPMHAALDEADQTHIVTTLRASA